jgi:hypothetical protein
MTPGYECPRARVLMLGSVGLIRPLALLRQIKDYYRLFEIKAGTKYCVRLRPLTSPASIEL